MAELPLEEPASKLLASGEATIVEPFVRRPRRRMFRRLNHMHVPGYAPICLDSNDPKTVAAGAVKRYLRDVPKADPVLIRKFSAYVKQFVETLPKVDPMSFDEWLEGTSYNEERKNQLRAANDELRGGRPSRKMSRHVDSFIKSEFYPCYKFPRHINSRHDLFKAFTGPAFKTIEELVYSTVPEFIKHVPVAERPKRVSDLKQSGRRYFLSDFTAFESHFVPEFMEACELQLYRHVLGNWVHADYICSILKGVNEIKSRIGFKARVRGRRMSGDMCTSLGNGFSNLMLAKFLASEQGKELYGFVEGDDGLFSTEAVLRSEDYAKLGFTIKLVELPDPCAGSPVGLLNRMGSAEAPAVDVTDSPGAFCGLTFADDGSIIRDPVKFMQGFGWTLSFLYAGPKIMDELLRAKALSALYETPQCPIVAPMAWKALALTRGVVPRFVDDGYHNVPRDEKFLEPYNPSSQVRELFFQNYGISPEVQMQCEKCIKGNDMSGLATLIPPPPEVLDYSHKYVVVT